MSHPYRPCARVLLALLCLFALATAALAAMPRADNLELTTYRGVSVEGKLTGASDDGVLHFEITTPPGKGEIVLEEDGSFVYTPKDGKKGKDYFGYRVTDGTGQVSEEATVIITIEKQKTKVTYSDMEGNGAEYAALRLAEAGLYTGSCTGGQYVFSPEESVSRGEFLAMCMELSGRELLSGVRSTGFADDGAIPAWVKPYVSTALLDQVITGYVQAGGAVFDAAAPVSRAEAAVILTRALGLTELTPAGGVSEDAATPVWAQQATANLQALDLMEVSPAIEGNLTRAECAQMLLGAMTLTDAA